MRKTLFAAMICLLASVAFAVAGKFQPLNVKTGLWQVTETSTVSGLPPQMAAIMQAAPPTRTYKTCVTTKELNANPWANGPNEKCTWTVLNSTSSDMELRGSSCAAFRDQGMRTDFHLKIHALDSENVKASVQGTSTGNGIDVNLNGTYTGKWLGATCADTK